MIHPSKYAPTMLAKRVRFCGEEVLVVCDGRCNKALGISKRRALTTYPDGAPKDFVPDAELGVAPADPGTCEGDDVKPVDPDERLNKWCIRECERHVFLGPLPPVKPYTPNELWEKLPETLR